MASYAGREWQWLWWNIRSGGGGSVAIAYVFADEAERDAFFLQNPDKLVDGLIILVGSQVQMYIEAESRFQDITPAFVGSQGPKGDTGATGPQGIQGEQGIPGADGTDGFSPIITVKTETPDIYVLTITTATGSFDTPNLRGGGSGSYGIFEYATATPYTTGNAMYSGNALYIAVKNFTSSSISADLIAGNIIQIASGGTTDIVIHPFVTATPYINGAFFYDNANGAIYTVITDNYTSTNIADDVLSGKIRPIGGSDVKVSQDAYNHTEMHSDGIYSGQEVIYFDHQPDQTEIDAIPDGAEVNIETTGQTSVYLSTADILDILTSGAVDKALSANMGRVLSERIDNMIQKPVSDGRAKAYKDGVWIDTSIPQQPFRTTYDGTNNSWQLSAPPVIIDTVKVYRGDTATWELFETDYSVSGDWVTVNSPSLESGDRIKITWTA